MPGPAEVSDSMSVSSMWSGKLSLRDFVSEVGSLLINNLMQLSKENSFCRHETETSLKTVTLIPAGCEEVLDTKVTMALVS